MNAVVVLTALNVEYRAVRSLLADLRITQHAAGTIFEEGRLRDCPTPVVIAVTGEGNLSAAVLAERANATFHPRALLFTGVAGGLKDELRLGDVVVASRIYSYHGGKESDEGFLARPRSWEASHGLLQISRHLDATGEWTRWLPDWLPAEPPGVYFKPIAAGEVVLNSRDSPLAGQLRGGYNDAAAIEMESAGAAHAAHLGSVPMLTVRGISDLADGNKYEADAGGWQRVAAVNAAAFAAAVIVASSGASSAPTWRRLADPLPVGWLPDFGPPRTAGSSLLELHLVPADPLATTVEIRRLAGIKDELAALGRAAKLFTLTEGLSATDPATVFTAAGSGLAVSSDGQRSAWQPLPKDSLGAVIDTEDVAGRLTALLNALVRIDAPTPLRAGLAVGISGSGLLSEGRVADLPRRTARPRTSTAPVRVQPGDTLPYARVTDSPHDVAEELAARLLLAFRAPASPARWSPRP